MEEIHKLIVLIWNKEELPQEWRESIIVPAHKKGDKMDCNNYREISLLSTSYKILSNILLSRPLWVGIVHRSLNNYLIAVENPGKPQLGDTLKTVLPVIISNGVHFSPKEGKITEGKERRKKGKYIFLFSLFKSN